eukprot:XP_014777242.1 PREDICTED: uncharacterized protein LOC106874139 [Octopus bimaculoides]
MHRFKDYSLHRLGYGYLLLWCLLSFPSLGYVLATTNCDTTCHCFISENSEEKGIIHVRPNCTQGNVTWPHPYNAVRLGLNPLTKGHEFETCVKIKVDFVSVIVYEENLGNIEGMKQLFIIQSGKERQYCKTSYSPITLFIEPVRSHVYWGPPKVVIYYERLELRSQMDPMRECRPCEEEELHKLFCTSDYNSFYRTSRTGPLKTTLVVPEKCKIQRGSGNFLFIARKRLDKSHLTCAPYLSHWEEIKERALQTGSMQCSYD